MRALDGKSFRFVCKGDELFVHGMAASSQSLAGSIVALVTTDQTVQVSAVDYREMVFDDVQSRLRVTKDDALFLGAWRM
jgi:hypothetical protein